MEVLGSHSFQCSDIAAAAIPIRNNSLWRHCLIVLYFLRASDGAAQILPVVSLYAFAGYRLLPELQKLFADAAGIRFNRAALDDLLEDYYELPKLAVDNGGRLRLERSIALENVTFAYQNAGAATRLYDSGDYATLLDRNPLFRAMSGARGPSATAPQVAGELASGSIRAGRIS